MKIDIEKHLDNCSFPHIIGDAICEAIKSQFSDKFEDKLLNIVSKAIQKGTENAIDNILKNKEQGNLLDAMCRICEGK